MQWVGPDTDQLLTARSDHLRSPTAPSAHRKAPAASSRPKSMVTAREDRVEDGLPTVGAAHVVEVVDLSVGDVPSSRPIGAGPCWSCRGGSALSGIADPFQLATAAACSNEVGSLAGAWREAVYMPPPRLQLRPHRLPRGERQGSQRSAISAGHLQKMDGFQRGRWLYPLSERSDHLRSTLTIVDPRTHTRSE